MIGNKAYQLFCQVSVWISHKQQDITHKRWLSDHMCATQALVFHFCNQSWPKLHSINGRKQKSKPDANPRIEIIIKTYSKHRWENHAWKIAWCNAARKLINQFIKSCSRDYYEIREWALSPYFFRVLQIRLRLHTCSKPHGITIWKCAKIHQNTHNCTKTANSCKNIKKGDDKNARSREKPIPSAQSLSG